MQITFQDRHWALDLEELSLKQAMAIQAHMGTPLSKWEAALADPESPDWLKAVECLHWLMKAQNGDMHPIGTADFPVLAFGAAFAQAFADSQPAAEEPEAEPDPTTPEPSSASSRARRSPKAQQTQDVSGSPDG